MSDLRLYSSEELGNDGYPAEWHDGIKQAVRAAAAHRCIRCGHPYRSGEHGNGEWSPCDEFCRHRGPMRVWGTHQDGSEGWGFTDEGPTEAACSSFVVACGRVEAQWRVLTVHHLDSNKANCCWWNLAALCQRCHLQIQGKVQMARVWPWEHSEWFRPYVAGYYAHAYLGEDLTREQTTERLDDLLALERAA